MVTFAELLVRIAQDIRGRSPVGHTHDDRYQRGPRITIPQGADLDTYRGREYEGTWTINQDFAHTLIGLPPGFVGAGMLDVTWAHAWAQTQVVTEMRTGRRWSRGIFASASKSPWVRLDRNVKVVGVPLTGSDGGGSNIIGPDYAYRLPLNFGARIHRFRLRLRNYDYRDDATKSGTIALHSVSLGEAVRNSAGELTGALVAGTIQDLALTGTAADGAEIVTDWAVAPLDPSRTYLLTYRITGGATQVWSTDMAGSWEVTTPTAAHTAGAAVTRQIRAPLSVSLDAEVDESTPVYGAFGDSLTVGSGSTLPVHDSWIAAYARTHGGLYTMWAAHGDTLESWGAVSSKVTRFAGLARPDVLFVAMGSNDIWTGADLPTLQTRLRAALATLRAHTTTNIVLCSVWPRDSTADESRETIRRAYNDWLRTTLPGGASRYVATWPAISADDSTLRDEYDSDGTHLTTTGYAAVASILDAGSDAIPGIEDRLTAIGYDTGWRDITSLSQIPVTSGRILLRRTGKDVKVRLVGLHLTSGTGGTLVTLPTGFRPGMIESNTVRGVSQQAQLSQYGHLQIYFYQPDVLIEGGLAATTDQSPPPLTSLPGAPA